MATPLEQFIKYVEDSGLLAGDTLADFVPPKAAPKDAEDLARELVRQKKLTKFQAEELYRGKGKSLILGNYVLMEKIGAGGMGQVFKAEHRRMHRMVAIKLLPAAMTKDKAAIARFEREVTAAAKLRHPNIIAADDADQANGVHFLVMELVDGSDLSAIVKKNGPLAVDKAVNYVLQAARGLEFAHAEGIVHRDIKPANLLLDKKGTVKILDMGLARIHGEVGQAELTSTGAVMGTIDYMAPEQALNTKTADARADIYALGCSLYFLLTARATYDGDSLMAKLLAHREHPIPDLQAACPQVSDQLKTIFKKMVAKRAEDRYQNMAAVIADLEGCAGGQTVAPPPPSFAVSDPGLTNFLKEVEFAQQSVVQKKPPVRTPQQIGPKSDWQAILKDKRNLLIGGGVLGALVLVAVVFLSGNAKSGKRVVKVKEPDANKADLDPQEKTQVAGGEPWKSPGFKKWVQSVADMPAEQQLTAVKKKLIELNPQFDGKITGMWGGSPGVEGGVVREIGFFTNQVSDISPVLALSGLRQLSCSGYNGSKLSDLRPLREMHLSNLCFQSTLVEDLTPLSEMRLGFLSSTGSPIRSLLPIKNMPLTNLSLSSLADADLSPLEGMKLQSFIINDPNIKDISVLKGMPLQSLTITSTGVSDLSPLNGMPLEVLHCVNAPISDLAPLQGLKLKTLSFSPENITSGMSALREMNSLESISVPGHPTISATEFWKKYDAGEFGNTAPKTLAFQTPGFDQWVKGAKTQPPEKQVAMVGQKLQELNPGFDGKLYGNFWDASSLPVVQDGNVVELMIYTDKVSDLSPLLAFPELVRLGCYAKKNPARQLDLSPLQGTKVSNLTCSQEVVDYSMLRGLKLTAFSCFGPGNTDLTPLSGLPLQTLGVSGNWDVKNLEPLRGMPLTVLSCDNCLVADLSPLKEMRLTFLACFVTQVADLSPLKGMPLEQLYCHETPITDFSPLAGMKLKKLSFTPKPNLKGLPALREMDSLMEIGIAHDKLMPSAEFWKKYDAGAFTAP